MNDLNYPDFIVMMMIDDDFYSEALATDQYNRSIF